MHNAPGGGQITRNSHSATRLVLLSAFYYGDVICMPGMGWLAERYGAKRVPAAGVARAGR